MAAIFFCQECGTRIGNHFKTMVLIAAYFIDYGIPVKINMTGPDSRKVLDFLDSVAHLEALGCVISTETGRNLTCIKPLGIHIDKDEKERPVWCMDKRHMHERV